MHSRQPAAPGVAMLLGLLLAAAGAEPADGGTFAVRNAFVELAGDNWQLGVSLDLGLTDAAAQALEEGIPLTLRLEAEALSERRLLPDEKVVSRTWQWQLEHDALTSRYILGDLDRDARESFVSREEALAALARPSGLLLAGTDRLPANRRFDVRVRAVVEIGDMPAAVRVLLFWRSFSEDTGWYAWTVRP